MSSSSLGSPGVLVSRILRPKPTACDSESKRATLLHCVVVFQLRNSKNALLLSESTNCWKGTGSSISPSSGSHSSVPPPVPPPPQKQSPSWPSSLTRPPACSLAAGPLNWPLLAGTRLALSSAQEHGNTARAGCVWSLGTFQAVDGMVTLCRPSYVC